ncbi:nuclear transport factor 2 family protein [Rhodoplanes sp. SY1]|uniref:nuclear transport factor 2 family protein n=1 Tax=Rhodoplanes sp. SY1 TaxID=3166646 RepID=UPI0038B67258
MPTISSEQDALALVKTYLAAMQMRDCEAASDCLSEGAVLTFPGGVRRDGASAIAAGSASRYRRNDKTIEAWEVSHQDQAWVVYCRGTLFGEWPDGRPFSGIRFIDRFEVGAEGITRQDVWNDTGEVRPR